MKNKQSKHQVIILEDSDCFFQGIKSWLSGNPDISLHPGLIGWDSLQHPAHLIDGNILVTSLHYIHLNPGFSAFRLFMENNGHTRVLCFVFPCPQFVIEKFIAIGVRGFIDWSAKAEEFCLAVKEVAAGRLFVSARVPDLQQKAEEPDRTLNPPADLGLTKREMEVLCLICQGHSSKEIAAKLFLSKRTIDGYRASLLSKFGTNKSAEMIRIAMATHYIPGNPKHFFS